MWDRLEDGTILMFEFVPKFLESFPIGKDLYAFADYGHNIDFFDWLEKTVSFETSSYGQNNALNGGSFPRA
jgi:hypothetical protein